MIDDDKISDISNKVMREIYSIEYIDFYDVCDILIPIIFDILNRHAIYRDGIKKYKLLIPKLVNEFYQKFDEYVKEKGEA